MRYIALILVGTICVYLLYWAVNSLGYRISLCRLRRTRGIDSDDAIQRVKNEEGYIVDMREFNRVGEFAYLSNQEIDGQLWIAVREFGLFLRPSRNAKVCDAIAMAGIEDRIKVLKGDIFD